MTQEEFAKNLEYGRAWLKRYGWIKYLQSDEYWIHPGGWGEMWEPVPNSPYSFWKCYINYDEDLDGQLDTAARYTEATGATPFKAMKQAMFDWDNEMRIRHDKIFKPVIDEIREQAEKMIEDAKMNPQGMCSVNADELAKMNKDTFSAMGLNLTASWMALTSLLGGI